MLDGVTFKLITTEMSIVVVFLCLLVDNKSSDEACSLMGRLRKATYSTSLMTVLESACAVLMLCVSSGISSM